MKDIKEITKKLIAFRDARDWKQFHNPKDIAISLLATYVDVDFVVLSEMVEFGFFEA